MNKTDCLWAQGHRRKSLYHHASVMSNQANPSFFNFTWRFGVWWPHTSWHIGTARFLHKGWTQSPKPFAWPCCHKDSWTAWLCHEEHRADRPSTGPAQASQALLCGLISTCEEFVKLAEEGIQAHWLPGHGQAQKAMENKALLALLHPEAFGISGIASIVHCRFAVDVPACLKYFDVLLDSGNLVAW